MTTYPPLSLIQDWTCDYFEPEPPTLYEFQDGVAVATLRGWRPEQRYDASWVAWLQKWFTLEITDVCVNYALIIESAPMGTQVYMNGARLAEYNGLPLSLDVTDVITWESNTLAFRVPCGGEGAFSGVVLVPTPCN